MRTNQTCKIFFAGIGILLFAFLLVGCSEKSDSASSAVSSSKPDLSMLTDDELVDRIKNANRIKTMVNKYKLFGLGIEHNGYNRKNSWEEGFTLASANGKMAGSYLSGSIKGVNSIIAFEDNDFYSYDSKTKAFSQIIFLKSQYEEIKSSMLEFCGFLVSPHEKIASVKRNADCIYINTEYNASDDTEYFKKKYGFSNGIVKIRYSVSPYTLLINRKNAVCLTGKGKQLDFFDTSIYDPTKLSKKGMQNMKAINDVLSKGERNFTVVFDNKSRETYKARAGLKVVFRLPDGYYHAYSDKACTKIYTSEATRENETIYFNKGK